MQNHTDSWTPHFTTPESNMDISSQKFRTKSPIVHKIWYKLMFFFKFVVCFQYFDISFNYMCCYIICIKFHNQNMAILLNIMSSTVCMEIGDKSL